MDRRRFLELQLKGSAALAAAGAGLWRPSAGLAAGYPDLAVVKGDRTAAVRAAVELLGGMGRFVKPGQRVVIKPNMSFPKPPEAATNTHPETVAALAKLAHEAGASRVLILDNPLGLAEACLERSGIASACRTLEGASTHTVEDDDLFQATPIPRAKAMTETAVMKQVLKSDVLIAAPTAKSHSSAGVSLSLKGMMGLILNRRVMHWRYDLDESIVDLNTLLRADLTLIDASRVLSDGGPGGPGRIYEPRTMIASTDPVAADAMTVAMFEFYGRRLKPRQINHINLAHQRGLGRMDVDKLAVKKVVL